MRKGTRTVTTHQGLRLATGVVVENMGTTVLVMIPGQHDVLTLTGPAADVVNAVVAGQPVSKGLEPEVELLLSAGVLTSPMSRRNLLRAGAIGAGAGIAVLSMPSVAAAASPGGGTGGGEDPVFTFTDFSGQNDNDGNPVLVNGVQPVNANSVRLLLRDEPRFNSLTTGSDIARLTNTSTVGSIDFRNTTADGPRFFEPSALTAPHPPLSAFQPGSGVTFTLTFLTAPNNAIGPLVRTL